jgi:hypothetical protein
MQRAREVTLAKWLSNMGTPETCNALMDFLTDLNMLARCGQDPIAATIFFRAAMKRLAGILDEVGTPAWRDNCDLQDVQDEHMPPNLPENVFDFLMWKQSHARPIRRLEVN